MVDPAPGNSNWYEEFLADAPCGFLSVDLKGNIGYANNTLERWLAYDAGALGRAGSILNIFSRASRLYYEAQVSPMIRVQGFVREISCQLITQDGQRTVPVLMNAKFRKATERTPGRVDFVFFDATERLQFERSLHEARSEAEELAAIVKNATVGILRVDHDGRLKRWNASAETILRGNQSQYRGTPIAALLCTDDMDADWFENAKKKVRDLGGEYRFDANIRRRIFLNISVDEIVNTEPFTQSDYSIILRDVTDRVRDTERLSVMVQELNHRVKNTLAVVVSVIRMTLRGSKYSAERKALTDRLQSIATSHDILTQHYWENVDITELVRPLQAQFEDSDRVTWEGPAVLLSPNQFKALSMTFHELMTNAMKYGALSNENGKVTIHWARDGSEQERLTISWIESGGPQVCAPESGGFGTVMIEKMLEAEFSGETEMNFRPEGLCFTFVGVI